MDWPSYVQRMLYGGGNQPSSLTGGYAGPMMLAALQRFIIENSYAISMARQGAAIAQDIASQKAEQQAAAMANIPMLGGLTGQAAGAQTMANAAAAGDAMIAEASGQPTWTQQTTPSGWDPFRQMTS